MSRQAAALVVLVLAIGGALYAGTHEEPQRPNHLVVEEADSLPPDATVVASEDLSERQQDRFDAATFDGVVRAPGPDLFENVSHVRTNGTIYELSYGHVDVIEPPLFPLAAVLLSFVAAAVAPAAATGRLRPHRPRTAALAGATFIVVATLGLDPRPRTVLTPQWPLVVALAAVAPATGTAVRRRSRRTAGALVALTVLLALVAGVVFTVAGPAPAALEASVFLLALAAAAATIGVAATAPPDE